jgi:DNA polymerase-1
MPIDLEAAAELTSRLERDLEQAKANLIGEAELPPDFNLNSPQQVAGFLYQKRFTYKARVPIEDGIIAGLDVDGVAAKDRSYHFVTEKLGRKWAHGVWSCAGKGLMVPPRKRNPKTGEEGPAFPTDTPTLMYFHGSDPWVREYCLSYKKLDKVLSTYLRKYPEIARGGRIYPEYNQTGTVTGRLSSSNPNGQNQPSRGELGKAIRGLFKGNLVVGDYDGLEMRLMAHFSQDPRLLQVFRDRKDPHATTASAIFGPGFSVEQRDVGKTVNYALGYGAGPGKLALVLSLAGHHTSTSEAADYMREVQDFYERLFEWRDEVIEDAAIKGSITTLMGRTRHLAGAHAQDIAPWKTQAYGARQAVNSLIQGSAADIIQRVMPKVDWPDMWLIAQIHDELLHEWEKRPTREMLGSYQALAELGHGFRLTVPLVFEPHIVKSWAGKSGEVELDLEESVM